VNQERLVRWPWCRAFAKVNAVIHLSVPIPS
jgi:hypothetical protein